MRSEELGVSTVSESSFPWYALHVKNRHEKHVAVSLESKGCESFLPTYTKLHEKSKKFELPLFPGYVFCRFPRERILPAISTPGVFSIVSYGPSPARISDDEVEDIRRVVESGSQVQPWSYLGVGKEVRLKSGPLRGLEGIVVEESNQTWVVISVHLLQRSVALKVERSQLS
jgi:transcription termination/antitermination protein NusG